MTETSTRPAPHYSELKSENYDVGTRHAILWPLERKWGVRGGDGGEDSGLD